MFYKNKKFIDINLFVLFFFCVLLLVLRLFNTISFIEPLHVQTGGAEDTGIFAIWLIKNSFNSYSHYLEFELEIENSHLFSAFHYNWLFYYLHAFLAKFSSDLLKLDDLWLPTQIRINTLIFSIIVFFYLVKIYNLFINSYKNIVFAFYIIFGPLTGFWVMSVKPDITYLLFEVVGIFLIIKNLKDLNYFKILLISILLIGAWSVKQNSFVTALSFALYLIFEKKYKFFFFFILNLTFFFIIIITLGPETLLENLSWQKGSALRFDSVHFYNVFKDSFSKILIIYTSLFIFIIKILYRKTNSLNLLKKDKKKYFLIIGSVCSLSQILFSFHYGSAVNYYFIFSIYISIYLINYIGNSNNLFLNLSIIVQIILILLILIGFKGRNSPVVYKNINEYINCVKNLKSPIYSSKEYYRLPWITLQKDNNPIMENMMSENYYSNNLYKLRPISKLISDGKFSSLIFFGKHKNLYDLKNYKFLKYCSNEKNISIYIKK